MLPDTIGRYRIEQLIGSGAMGLVYQAHDPLIDRRVAIKLVRADLLAEVDGSEFLERFRQEAQAAGRCQHPNIVAIFDYALHEGAPFIAMEFVPGKSLAELHPIGTRLRPNAAAAIVLQILAALQAAHALGIVHRDIKPANILITPAQMAKITDFGIARLSRAGLTQTGTMIGTLSYMSPEQCLAADVDHRADLFSTGCILHELLLGVRPFGGTSEADIIRRLMQEPPIFPPDHDVAPALLDVLRQALAKDQAARFASAEAMADALRLALRQSAGAGHQDDTGAAADATIVQVRSSPGQTTSAGFDVAVLADMERQLAAYLGPIARTIVQSAARRAPDLEALRDIVAKGIDLPADRERFRRESSSAAGRQPTMPGTSALPPSDAITPAMAAAAGKELARHVGPIAAILVRKAVPTAKSAADLCAILAAHIDSPSARASFLQTMQSRL